MCEIAHEYQNPLELNHCFYIVQRKSFFTACHLSNLKLAFTSPNVISTSPKIFWWAELISNFFCKLNSSKYFTCPSGKLRTEFTGPIAKSTSPRLSNTTFFAHCSRILIVTSWNLCQDSKIKFKTVNFCGVSVGCTLYKFVKPFRDQSVWKLNMIFLPWTGSREEHEN